VVFLFMVRFFVFNERLSSLSSFRFMTEHGDVRRNYLVDLDVLEVALGPVAVGSQSDRVVTS